MRHGKAMIDYFKNVLSTIVEIMTYHSEAMIDHLSSKDGLWLKVKDHRSFFLKERYLGLWLMAKGHRLLFSQKLLSSKRQKRDFARSLKATKGKKTLYAKSRR